MMTKTITLLTILAAMLVARVVSIELVKHPVITITDEISYPATDENVDCEYVVTPSDMKLIRGGADC